MQMYLDYRVIKTGSYAVITEEFVLFSEESYLYPLHYCDSVYKISCLNLDIFILQTMFLIFSYKIYLVCKISYLLK